MEFLPILPIANLVAGLLAIVILLRADMPGRQWPRGLALLSFVLTIISSVDEVAHSWMDSEFARQIAEITPDSSQPLSSFDEGEIAARVSSLSMMRHLLSRLLGGADVILITMALALLTAAIFTGRNAEPHPSTRASPAVRIGIPLVSVGIAAFWSWLQLDDQQVFRWFNSVTIHVYLVWFVFQFLPWLWTVTVAFGFVLFSPTLGRARQYAFLAVCLKMLGFLLSCLWSLSQPDGSLIGQAWLSGAQAAIEVAGQSLLLAAVLADRGTARRTATGFDVGLEDPLFEVRRLIRRFGWTLAAVCAIGLGTRAWLNPTTDTLILSALFAFGITFAVWIKTVSMTFMMPHRPPNAIYLRSFRNDSASYPIRVAIQESLGPQFRLTGIRDPRRRSASAWEYIVGPAIWAFRYCTPKFMDLEAGDDWKMRLWNTLQAGRMAVIDLTDLTPFVMEEVRLATEALGFDRVLFVIDESRSRAEWIAVIQEGFGKVDSLDKVRLADWSAAKREAFCRTVRDFAGSLPPRPPHRFYPDSDYGLLFGVPFFERKAVSYLMVFVALQSLMAVGVMILKQWPTLNRLVDDSALGRQWSPLYWTEVAMSLWVLWNLAIYARDVGVKYERQKAVIALVAYAALIVGVNVAVLGGLR